MSIKSPSLWTLPRIVLDGCCSEESNLRADNRSAPAVSSHPPAEVNGIAASSVGCDGAGTLAAAGSTQSGSMLVLVTETAEPRPRRACHLSTGICSIRFCGSVTFISNEDAATVAAEARLPMEPGSQKQRLAKFLLHEGAITSYLDPCGFQNYDSAMTAKPLPRQLYRPTCPRNNCIPECQPQTQHPHI